MEEVHGLIHFDEIEQRTARMPAVIPVAEAHDAFKVVCDLKTNCAGELHEISGGDILDLHPLHKVHAMAKLTTRFHRLHVMAQRLGCLADTDIVMECLAEADIPGLAIDYLYEK